jgi:hypothetical protein
MKKSRTAVLILAIFALLSGGVASAVDVVVPNSLENVEGNGGDAFPFYIGNNSARYQQVFDASQFAAFSEPNLITQIAFRPDAVFGRAFSPTLAQVQIDLSTTSAEPDALSPTFAENVGTDNTVVFSGLLPLLSAFTGPAQGPKDFDIIIPLHNPFLYDPAAGNLLLDLKNFSGGLITVPDAELTLEDSISRVYSYGADYPFGTADTTGLVVQFTAIPASVPEPSAMLLMGLGLAGTAFIRKRMRIKDNIPF